MDYLFLLGRILFGGYFIYGGAQHFLKFKWMTEYAKGKGVPFPGLAIIVTGLLLVLGGLWVILGMYARVGLYELIIFLVAVTPVMHRFWEQKDANQRLIQSIYFAKNLALLGAALMMMMLPEVWPLALNIR